MNINVNLEKGFFEYISAADNEKVHSQTIGWILSPNCKAIDIENKNLLLKHLTRSNQEFKIKNVFVEVFDIDILVVCENSFVVIENKIKASQHGDQLGKYVFLTSKIVDGKDPEKFKNGVSDYEDLIKSRRRLRQQLEGLSENFVYLTLLDEKSGSDNWKSSSYKSFAKYFIENIKIKENQDGFIVKSYLYTLNNLTTALECINNDKTVIKWMFNNGGTSKRNLLENELDTSTYPNTICQYLAESGLIRFAQKYYYKNVAEILDKSETFKLKVQCSYGSSNSNGQGLIQIDFPEFSFKRNGQLYRIGYQIQGITEKINVSDSNYDNATDLEVNLFKKLVDLDQKLNLLKSKLNFRKRNPGVSKPYHSISNTLEMAILNYTPNELADYIIKCINERSIYLKNFYSSL